MYNFWLEPNLTDSKEKQKEQEEVEESDDEEDENKKAWVSSKKYET